MAILQLMQHPSAIWIVGGVGFGLLVLVLAFKLALARLNARIVRGRVKRMKDTQAQIEDAWATEADLESYKLLTPGKKGFRQWLSRLIPS